MEEVLLETIADIQARKRLANERPDHVPFLPGFAAGIARKDHEMP